MVMSTLTGRRFIRASRMLPEMNRGSSRGSGANFYPHSLAAEAEVCFALTLYGAFGVDVGARDVFCAVEREKKRKEKEEADGKSMCNWQEGWFTARSPRSRLPPLCLSCRSEEPQCAQASVCCAAACQCRGAAGANEQHGQDSAERWDGTPETRRRLNTSDFTF